MTTLNTIFTVDRLRSRPYALIFTISAILFAFEIGVLTFSPPGDLHEMYLPIRLPIVLLGMCGTVGSFVLWFGMWCYWRRVDPSSKWAKVFWFVILLFGTVLGGLFYFLFVYLPQLLNSRNTESASISLENGISTANSRQSRLAWIVITLWAIFWTVDLLFPLFPETSRLLHVGRILSIYGLLLTAGTIVVGFTWLWRSGLRTGKQ